MPVMDGLTASRKIRSESLLNKSTPIVAVTAHCTDEDEQASLDAGMNAHLLKPINHYELLLAVHRFTHQNVPIELPLNSKDSVCEAPILAGIDTSIALPRVNNNLTLYKKILHIFLNNNRSSYSNLSNAIKHNNIEESIRISHSLKGSSATIGANNLSKIAACLEQDLRNQRTEQAHANMDLLEIELSKVLSSLETLDPVLETTDEPRVAFNHNEVVKSIESIQQYLFEDLSTTESLIDKLIAVDFPEIYKSKLSELKSEYEHFNLIQVEKILHQLQQMIANTKSD